MEHEWPRQSAPAASATCVQQLRAEYDMRDDGARWWGSEGTTAWTVVYEPAGRLVSSPLWRTVPVVRVGSLAEAAELVRPLRGHIQGIAVYPIQPIEPHGYDPLFALGPSRVCELGRLQVSPLDWPEDNQPVLGGLAGGCCDEAGS